MRGRNNAGMHNKSYGKSYREEDRHLIENYEEAIKDPRKWIIIHRLEYDENWNRVRSTQDLKDAGLYYHRPANELKYIRMTEYFKLNPVSEKKRAHASKMHSGENNYWYGKSLSEETKLKISAKKRLAGIFLAYSKNPTQDNYDAFMKLFPEVYPEYAKYVESSKVG